MKFNISTFRIGYKWKPLLLFTLLLCMPLNSYSERMETIASFKSNFKLGKSKHQNTEKSQNLHKAENSSSLKSHVKVADTSQASASQLIQQVGKDLPDIPIYFQGWVKYFRYVENGGEKPKMFFKNSNFLKQRKPKPQEKEKDKYGFAKIPSEKHFFFVVYKDTANILTSRENPLMTVADSLIIDFIKTIPEDNNYEGGIKDFGKFSEGSCFEVSTVKPGAFFQMSSDETEPSKGIREVWLICSEDDATKRNMMDILIKLKLKKQHSLGVYISNSSSSAKGSTNTSLSPSSNQPTLADIVNGSQKAKDAGMINPSDAKPIDGYWITLQDWTGCTLKCGGGLQYLQLMCIPPKKGGKNCLGEAIRTRPCNPQPCPQVNILQALLPDKSTVTIEKPIVKMMAISSRPQRYDKCYLKDTDALMVKNDLSTASFDNLPKIPIRLVMNNKSISVYQDESLQTNLMTFILSATSFSRIKGSKRCFILTGLNNKTQFCQLDSEKGKFVEEWEYDFSLFKFQCKQKRETVKVDNMEQRKLEKDFNAKVDQLKQDMVQQKASAIKLQVENKEEVKLQKQVEQTQAMTLMAIQKESKLEEMLEKEELQKEKDQENVLQAQIEAEKKKNECLTKSIKEKEIEDQMNMSKSNAQDTIQKIKEDAKKQIIIKRQEMKKKISAMRKKNSRKLNQLKNQIMNIRTETASKVQKFAKVGNQSLCFNPAALSDPNMAKPKVEEFCAINFSDNNGRFMECKNLDSFCFVCCESQFGDMHIPEREKCYKEVCETENNAPDVSGYNQSNAPSSMPQIPVSKHIFGV